MSDQRKQDQGTQQDEWQKKQNQQTGQQGGQRYPQSDRDRMDKEQERKPA